MVDNESLGDLQGRFEGGIREVQGRHLPLQDACKHRRFQRFREVSPFFAQNIFSADYLELLV